MRIYTQEVFIPKNELKLGGLEELQKYYESKMQAELPQPHRVLRFVVTKTDDTGYYCELDLIMQDTGEPTSPYLQADNIFTHNLRTAENTGKFTAVLIIPTGIGCEIGGHCGDGNVVARLMAATCDRLITHPNVVNASDVNEMTENALYVEGSILTRFMMGKIGLQPVRQNRMLMLMDKNDDKFFNDEVINAVSTARVTLGIDCEVYEMENITDTESKYSKSGRAVGEVKQAQKLFDVAAGVRDRYDVFAMSTIINMPHELHEKYYQEENIVNPFGGIEAMLTHSLAEIFRMPAAHSPMMPNRDEDNIETGIIDPRKAPESASVTYLHCILKGLHRAPRIVPPNKGITLDDVSCLVIPDGCVGLPTLSALANDITVIAVRENKNNMKNSLADLPFKPGKLFIVDNYLEAAGLMRAMQAGVHPSSVRRPIDFTKVVK
ncbi:MAG: hypothetical protein UV52_C0010G0005 [Parcubacteria group bacterium GW2011_GWD1_42_9]|nr:MAG: hypothetical protein UV52_C0010G0005 [Parcubacteria group bacterium GW2011_GWD1_42_9]